MTQPQRPLFDAGNTRLTTDVPADLDIGKIPVPGGEIGIATIRQGNTTLTIVLDHDGAETWAGLFSQLAGLLSGSGKIVVASRSPLAAAAAGQSR